MELKDIRRTIDYYTGDLYTAVRGQQGIDESYIDDSFAVPEVRAPHVPVRTGIGYQMVSAPAEQIVTSNPQAFIYTDKKTDQDSAKKLAKEINESWISSLRRQSPNIFKEAVKNKLSRGENYIRVSHNEKWVTGRMQRYGMPILFINPDPMVVYGSPEEDDCGWIPNVGVPNKVVIKYLRQPIDVILRYPTWSNPKNLPPTTKETENMVEWVEYWDKDTRYFEADGVPVLQGDIQPNLYRFTPFVRRYSGFGKRSPEGRLEELIFSDIRMSRDLIKEYTAELSDISSIMHIFAHKPVTIVLPPETEVDEDALRRSVDLGSYSVNLLYLPEGREIMWGETILPSPEAYQHLRDIRGDINQRHPLIMSGFPFGSSGRQQDLSSMAAMKRYDTVIENTETEFATAFEMGISILKKIPRLRPAQLSIKDLEVEYKCEVKLKAEDPIENDRQATLGSRLYAQGEIDLETNLVKYQKYTQNEADEIITNILAEKVLYGSPDIAELIGLRAAEKSGMAEDLEIIKQRRKQLEGMGQIVPSSEMRQRVGETRTPTGREMIDEALRNRGQRRSPEGFIRQ